MSCEKTDKFKSSLFKPGFPLSLCIFLTPPSVDCVRVGFALMVVWIQDEAAVVSSDCLFVPLTHHHARCWAFWLISWEDERAREQPSLRRLPPRVAEKGHTLLSLTTNYPTTITGQPDALNPPTIFGLKALPSASSPFCGLLKGENDSPRDELVLTRNFDATTPSFISPLIWVFLAF